MVLTLTFKDTFREVSLVKTAVGPLVPTSSVFLPMDILAFELDLALFPCFAAESMLLVVNPVAFVG